jgi:uncharacterized protein YvpB
MKIEDLAAIMGKSVSEVKDILKKQDLVEVSLKDDVRRTKTENCEIILV